MKKILPLLAFVLLCACIDVEDFGAYWDKGAVDLGLIGTWKKIGVKPHQDLSKTYGADEYRFIDKGPVLELEAYNRGRKEEEEHPMLAKTLRIGFYTFLIVGPDQGFIYRYEIKGDVLSGYSLKTDAAYRYLKKKYPHLKNLSGNQTGFKIGTFDAEVEKALGSVPDSKTYWALDNRYRKVK